jgi:hypothetical protein
MYLESQLLLGDLLEGVEVMNHFNSILTSFDSWVLHAAA